MRPWTAKPVAPSYWSEDWLQWGHGLAAVDGAIDALQAQNYIGFNGATALRPWTAAARSPPATS